jgi:adenylate cyclase
MRLCASCGEPAPRRAHWCLSCGTPLEAGVGQSCPACQTSNPERARYCLGCGARLASVADADRRVVSVLFADLSGFTQLTEQLDPEEVRDVIVSCLNLLSECIIRWGGFVDKFIGDCVMGLFGAPVAYENEEERALRSALDMQAAIKEWSHDRDFGPAAEYRPELRIGINTGPVVAGLFAAGGARDYTVIGDTVNVASRLQGLCEPGRILVGPATYEQTGHLFEFDEAQQLQVRGRREPVAARHVLGVREQRGKIRGFGDRRVAMVGRAAELAELREAWGRARNGEATVCLVSGAAGIGKTRLVEELIAAAGLSAEQVAGGRSYPYSRGSPWEPVAELVRDLYDLPGDLRATEATSRIITASHEVWPQDEAAGLKVLLGSPLAEAHELQAYGTAERRDRIAAAVGRSLRGAATEPRLLVLEDLHWADNTTLEFLCSLDGSSLLGPVLLLLVARPPLPGEALVARLFESVKSRIELRPLRPEEARAFINSLLDAHELPDDFITGIVERAEGNPLFIEETLKSLAERGALKQEAGGWRAAGDLADVEVPDTIESVLTTRIDGLDESTRQILKYAAIVGRRFWSGVLADALAKRSIDQELDDLQKSTFVRALPFSSVSGTREFMFEHLLLQEVAYEGMLRGKRAELHGSVARWFEEQPGSQRGEYDELIAFHRERSDEPASAVPFLERAARGARDRGALPDARKLLQRGLELAERAGDRARLLALLEDVAGEMGDVDARAGAIDELESLAADGDDRLLGEAAYRRARLLLDASDLKAAQERAAAALQTFERLGDESSQGDALRLLGRINHLWGDFPAALRYYRSSLPLEREAGDRQGQAEIFDLLGLAQVDLGDYTTGLDYFEAARDLCSELGNRPMEARVSGHQALALCALGRYDDAVASARAAVELAEACGSRLALAGAGLALAQALIGKGERGEAAATARAVHDLGVELRQPRIQARALLGLAQCTSGEESRTHAGRARGLAHRNGLSHVEILALTLEANLDLEAGDLKAAEEASAHAAETLDLHGSIEGPEEAVLFSRARVLNALGREDESQDALQRARTLVLNRADRIDDPGLREHYLERVPLNREILTDPLTREGA